MTFELCCGQLERLKPLKKICKICSSWMKDPGFQLLTEEEIAAGVFCIFIRTTYIVTFSIYLFSKFFFVF
jgi:hypothetical protein